jgi:acetyl esterase
MLPPADAWPGAANMSVEKLRESVRAFSTMAGPLPVPLAGVRDQTVPGPAGPLGVRIYTPVGEGPHPLIVYFHGGGYVTGDLDTQDMIARALCAGAGALTVSVDYRLAPEHPFPAAPEDAYAAFRWAAAEAQALGADPQRLVLAGDSAGANLAAAVALMAREDGGPQARAQLLFYGSANYPDDMTPSAREFADGPILTGSDVAYFWAQYLRDPQAERDDFRASPYRAPRHDGLPSAFVATAECDPSRDDAERYGRKLADAGVAVQIKRYAGMPHGFVSWLGVVPAAQQAVDDACAFLAARS